MGTVRIPLPNGQYALIDEEDYDLVSPYAWRARVQPRGTYAYTIINGKNVGMHTLILPPPSDHVVDHRDHDGLNNRRSNLRIATVEQNARNRRKLKKAKSKYKGVGYRAWEKRWTAQIRINGKVTQLGQFRTEEEAARAYDAAARKHHGEFACVNFPEHEREVRAW